ncbi:MAG: hypothetical protein ACFB11_00680 [Paracoccaceae bacterium]
MSERMAVAHDAWGEVPDWVVRLVEACDAKGQSQGKIAKKLGCTPGVVSAVIRNNYKADPGRIEDRVRAVFMPTSVQCPALGEISSADCMRWLDRKDHDHSAMPLFVRMRKACKTCPIQNKDDEDD